VSAEGIIVLLVLMLLVGVPSAALYGKRVGQKAPLPPPHQHDWPKWRDAELIRTRFGKPAGECIGQTRVCNSCGKREIREVTA
jgi:hypothetical protein